MTVIHWLLAVILGTVARLWSIIMFGFNVGMTLTGNPVFAMVTAGAWVALVTFVVVNLFMLALPLLVAVVLCYSVASMRGWDPERMWRVAALSVPMLLTYVGLVGLLWFLGPGTERSETWVAVAIAPVNAFVRFHEFIAAGDYVLAVVDLAAVAIPVGLIIAAVMWRSKVEMMEAGLVGYSLWLPDVYEQQQWRRATRTAKQRVRAPGGVPLLSRRGNPIVGATIRSMYRGSPPTVEIAYRQLRNHIAIVGTTGAGKSTLLVRLWQGYWAAAMRLFLRRREFRPWIVIIDAKGGFDGRDTAERALRALQDVGAGQLGRVAIWPDQVALNLWQLPPGRLVEVLVDLVPTAKEGPAAYYADVLAAVVDLAVRAPGGPPKNGQDFLRRLDPTWLKVAYAAETDRQLELRAAEKHAGDIALRYRTLLLRLGTGFEGTSDTQTGAVASFDRVTDFDVLYCILEGTASVTTAEAQARALVELISDAATRWGRDPIDGQQPLERRAGLIALDEFSAVAGRLRIYEQTERWRSLGLAVQVGAQSWESLGPTEDERLRLAGTAAGGVFVMRSPNPEALCKLAGTFKRVEVGRKIVDGGYGDEGTARLQDAFVVDPNKVRAFHTGQAALIEGNTATYLQVAPYRPLPYALPAARIHLPDDLDDDLHDDEAGDDETATDDAADDAGTGDGDNDGPGVAEPDPRPVPATPRPPATVEPLDDLDDVFGEDRQR